MDNELKYNKVYNLKIKDNDYKCIYLGRRNSKSKYKTTNLILVNKSHLSLIGFNEYDFDKDGKLILKNLSYIFPSRREMNYLEELLQKIQ